MLALFSLLGASWPHFLRLTALVGPVCCFLRVFERSNSDFEALWARFSRFWSLQNHVFPRFFVLARLRCPNAFNVTKTTVLLGRNTLRQQHERRNRRRKIAPNAFRMELPTRKVPQNCFGARQARFWKALGVSWACLGRNLDALGELLASLGRLCAASWTPFWRFLGARGRSWALTNASGLDFGRSWVPPGWVLESS